MVDSIPVIDFSAYSLARASPDPDRFQELVDDVTKALTTIGFMYLKNVGISAQKIQDLFLHSKSFFYLPLETKLQYSKPTDEIHGYIEMEREQTNPERKFNDLKECFNYAPCSTKQPFPDDTMPEFQSSMKALFDVCILLQERILEVMARGLQLEDPMFFVDRHVKSGTADSMSTLRTLLYPALSAGQIKSDQVRCGEHTDFGGITILFQSSQAGLEVRNVHGDWIQAPPIEGTVLINIGALMQRWTADILLATEHRVLAADQISLQKERQSIAFFGMPDNDVLVECIDGSKKHPPITPLDYANQRFQKFYVDHEDVHSQASKCMTTAK